MRLSDIEIDSYRQNGYLPRIRVADEAQIARFRSSFDEIEAREGREKAQIGLVDLHFTEPFVRDLAVHPNILDAVESLIGPDILLLASHFFCKYGPRQEFVAWHQDVTYWGLEPPEAITAWYAIDDSDRENGCMRVIPQSQHEIRTHETSSRAGNLLSINQELSVSDSDEALAVDLELRAGEISIHDGRLIHGSMPNSSDRRRCGLTLRYVAPRVKPINDISKWKATPVRGEDRYHHFGNSRIEK